MHDSLPAVPFLPSSVLARPGAQLLHGYAANDPAALSFARRSPTAGSFNDKPVKGALIKQDLQPLLQVPPVLPPSAATLPLCTAFCRPGSQPQAVTATPANEPEPPALDPADPLHPLATTLTGTATRSSRRRAHSEDGT